MHGQSSSMPHCVRSSVEGNALCPVNCQLWQLMEVENTWQSWNEVAEPRITEVRMDAIWIWAAPSTLWMC